MIMHAYTCIRLAKMGFRQKKRLRAHKNTQHTEHSESYCECECEHDRTISIKSRLNLQQNTRKKKMAKKKKLKTLQSSFMQTIGTIKYCVKYDGLTCKSGKMNMKQQHTYTGTHNWLMWRKKNCTQNDGKKQIK